MPLHTTSKNVFMYSTISTQSLLSIHAPHHEERPLNKSSIFIQSTLPSLGATIEQILYNLPPGVTLTPVAFVCTQHAPAYTKLQEIINIPYHQYKIYTPRYPIRDIAAYPCRNLTFRLLRRRFNPRPPRGERQIRRNLTLRLLRHFQPDADDHVSC